MWQTKSAPYDLQDSGLQGRRKRTTVFAPQSQVRWSVACLDMSVFVVLFRALVLAKELVKIGRSVGRLWGSQAE